MTPSRIVIATLAATVSICFAVARLDANKRERRALPAFEMPRSGPLTPVSAPAAPGRTRFDAEVERACRTVMRCLLDDWQVADGVAGCVAEVNAKIAPELADLADLRVSADDMADELAVTNARCANRCDGVVSCYASMGAPAAY